MANAHRTEEQVQNHEEFRKALEAEYGPRKKRTAAKKTAAPSRPEK